VSTLHVEYPGGIEQARADAKRRIDLAAGKARAQHITAVDGQAETYLSKYEDALAFEAGSAGPHPWVKADAQALSVTAAEAAAAIIAARNAWLAVGVEIERERMSAKKAADDATTTREALAAAELIESLWAGGG